MKPILLHSAGLLAVLAVTACAPATDGAPGDTGKGVDGAYNGPGAKYVTQDQADWLSRTHSRPAGGP